MSLLFKVKAVGLLLCFVLVSSMGEAAEPGRKMIVVATNSILADLVKNVGGEAIELHTLVGPNADVHTFEPTPQDSVLLAKAHMIFEIGLHLEPWLNDLHTASASHAHRYCVSDQLNLIHIHPSEFDPHVWHDPQNVIIMIEAIRNALATEDPAHGPVYHDQARKYVQELVGLENWIATQLAHLPVEKRKLATSHDTFAYFAKRYEFAVIGAVIDSSTTEAVDPSALKMAQLIEKIKASGVRAIFLENVSNSKTTEALAREAGVAIAPKLYTDALGAPGSPASTYLDMIKYNVTTIVEALQ